MMNQQTLAPAPPVLSFFEREQHHDHLMRTLVDVVRLITRYYGLRSRYAIASHRHIMYMP